MGKVDHALRCVVVDSNWKRARFKTDFVAPWVASGALKGSEPSMMRVTEAQRDDLTRQPTLREAIVRAKR